MEDKIEVGEYVRTKRGIGKILEIKTVQPKMYGKYDVAYLIDICPRMYITQTEFIKHSKNIIDLIEEGDFVNGEEVIEVRKEDNKIYLMTGYCPQKYIKDEIKSIVTKEQFNSIKYEIE